jgi:hypothetical protein
MPLAFDTGRFSSQAVPKSTISERRNTVAPEWRERTTDSRLFERVL